MSSKGAFALLLCLCVGAVQGGEGGELEDGLYVTRDAGSGRTLPRNDGARVVLGERVGRGLGTATFSSQKNDNSVYRLDLKNVGPLEKAGVGKQLTLVIDGIALGVWGQSDLHADGTLDLGTQIYGVGAAQKIAARFKAELPRRKHPGHRFEVRWTPDKDSYAVGEPITLKMELLNIGDVPMSFMNGGQQRGPRDNQFRFLAYRGGGGGKAVPDTGDPANFGGIGGFINLKPGESFTKTVALDKWFNFTEPDTYRITGLFEMRLATPGNFQGVIWDELAVGDCLVRVGARPLE